MNVDIYQNKDQPRQFVSVPTGKTLNTAGVPESIQTSHAPLVLIYKNFDFGAGVGIAGIHPANVMGQIGSKGYAVHEASVTVTNVSTNPGV